MARNAELEDEIRRDFERLEAYQVYGDWLTDRGDPRGELISIQLAMGEGDTWKTARPVLWQAVDQLFQAHSQHFFGQPHGLGDDAPTLRNNDRVGDVYLPGWPTKSWSFGCSRSVWRHGFIDRLYLASSLSALIGTLELESSRLIRELCFGPFSSAPECDDALTAAVDSTCAQTLRTLRFDQAFGTQLGSLATCPLLEELEANGGQLSAELELPRLRSLSLDYSGELIDPTERLRTVLLRHRAPLQRLELVNTRYGDNIGRMLVETAIIDDLAALELDLITDRGAATLVAAADQLSGLEHLELAGLLSPEMVEALRALNIPGEVETYS